jgi:predicted phage terminase large subunit-like protein
MGELNDYTVGTTWAIKEKRVYLLDVVRERLEMPALKRRVIEEANRWNAQIVLIEDKGSGTGLLQELRASGFHRARPYMPVGDKRLRLASVTPMIEEGRFFLPASAPWLDIYDHELCGFPWVKKDDQVDSTSQFLAWFRDEGDTGGLYEYYRQEAEKKRALEEDRNVLMRAPAGRSHFSGVNGEWLSIGADGTIWLTELDARTARGAGYVDIDP